MSKFFELCLLGFDSYFSLEKGSFLVDIVCAYFDSLLNFYIFLLNLF